MLSSNSKLKKDKIFNFDIPAYKSNTGLITCPMAKDCIANCYARQGTYNFPVVKAKLERNLTISLTDDFITLMDYEIKKNKVKILRIHSSGDFYSREYIAKWMKIMELNPEVKFYAYTKSFRWFSKLPENFKLIQSDGGKDAIDMKKPHAIVVKKKVKGYKDASESDLVAYKNDKIQLVYHGQRKPTGNFVKESIN